MSGKKKPKGNKTRRQLPPGMTYADVLAMKKRQAEAIIEAARDDAVHVQADIHVQRIMWLMVVSVADAYGFGPKRMELFFKALQINSDEYERMKEEGDEEYALEKLRSKAEKVTGTKIEYIYEKEIAEVKRLMEDVEI